MSNYAFVACRRAADNRGRLANVRRQQVSDAFFETSAPDSPFDPQSWPLWVVEGTIDFPTRLPVSSTGSPCAQLVLCLGGEDADGFVQLRAHDRDQLAQASWWSANEHWVYDCRGLVRAPQALSALMRGSELYEHAADRLTLWSGYPVQVLSVGFTYNEDMLRKCAAGELTEYDSTSGGEYTFRVNPPKNIDSDSFFAPPAVALEAIRWFRHAMLAKRTLEQFLYYYIALESISRHVPGVSRVPRQDAEGNELEDLETEEAAAIKHLLRRRGLPLDGRPVLAKIRGRIAHGNSDWPTIMAAHNNMAALQRLAADGIALVYGLDPVKLQVMQPSPVFTLAHSLRVPYSAEDNPTVSWGGFLSDTQADYVARAKQLIPADAPPQPSN